MKNIRYYFIFMDKKSAGTLWLKSSAGENREWQVDITEFDLMTYAETKESFIEKIKFENDVDLTAKDFFLARVSESGKINVYDCLFKPAASSVFYNTFIEEFISLAKERLTKIYQNSNSLKSQETKKLTLLMNKLLLAVVSEEKCRLKITSSNSIVKPEHLREAIKRCIYTYQINQQSSFFLQYLSNYKTLRGLLLEYLNYYHPCISQNKLERIKRVNKMYVIGNTEYKKEETQPVAFALTDAEYHKVKNLLLEPFQNEELAYFYNRGGLEEVFHYMDTNDIYNSSKEDLLRCGILSKEDYMKLVRKKS